MDIWNASRLWLQLQRNIFTGTCLGAAVLSQSLEPMADMVIEASPWLSDATRRNAKAFTGMLKGMGKDARRSVESGFCSLEALFTPFDRQTRMHHPTLFPDPNKENDDGPESDFKTDDRL